MKVEDLYEELQDDGHWKWEASNSEASPTKSVSVFDGISQQLTNKDPLLNEGVGKPILVDEDELSSNSYQFTAQGKRKTVDVKKNYGW